MIPVFEKNLYVQVKTEMAILDLCFFEKNPPLWKRLMGKVLDKSNRDLEFAQFLAGRISEEMDLVMRLFNVVHAKKLAMSPKLLKGEDLETPQNVIQFPTGSVVCCDVKSLKNKWPEAVVPDGNILTDVQGYITISNNKDTGPFIHLGRIGSPLPSKMLVTPEFFTQQELVYD